MGEIRGKVGTQAWPGRASMVAGPTHNLGVSNNAAAVGGGEGGSTGLTVPGHVTTLGGAADREGMNAVGVAVTVAVVIVQATVARCPDEERA